MEPFSVKQKTKARIDGDRNKTERVSASRLDREAESTITYIMATRDGRAKKPYDSWENIAINDIRLTVKKQPQQKGC